MIVLKNKKKITVTFEGLSIPPNGEMKLSNEQWAGLYAKREIRGMIALGYMTAEGQEEVQTSSKNKKTNAKENE